MGKRTSSTKPGTAYIEEMERIALELEAVLERAKGYRMVSSHADQCIIECWQVISWVREDMGLD
jgi:hypothetical protein